jgi:uncharacterized protein YdcH (DUF465 family)
MDLHHPLTTEFPEFRKIIASLDAGDQRFHGLMEEYNRIDDEICKIEENLVYATDQEIDEKKLRRVQLKDQLYKLLKQTPVA